MHRFSRTLASVLIVSTALMGLPITSHAALVGTEEVIQPAAATAFAGRQKVEAFMARDDVRQALQDRGVDPLAARERAKALSDAEVAQLAAQIDSAPAAGMDVLGFFLVVFAVLLVTDVLGLTKVFPFTRTVR